MTESTFYKWIAAALQPAHIQRIESACGRGIPDMNVCADNKEFWVELKIVKHGSVYLRKEQYAWGLKRARQGGIVRVLALDADKDILHFYFFPDIKVKKSGISSRFLLRITSKPTFELVNRKKVYKKNIRALILNPLVFP